jgi:hypothetical protein
LLTGAPSGTAAAAQLDSDNEPGTKERPGHAAPYGLSLPAADVVNYCTRDDIAASFRLGFASRDRMITIAPKAAAAPDETHAAFVVSRDTFQNSVTFEGETFIGKQLPIGSQANPWETAWLVWHYTDNDHFYYIALKTNGWELGKHDPAYPGGQRCLASGDDIRFTTGAWYGFRVDQHGATMTVALDGKEIVTFADREAAYTGGKLGIYSEDARVRLDQVSGSITDDFEAYDLQTLRDGARLGGTWEVAFLGYGVGSVMSDRIVLTPVSALEPTYEGTPQRSPLQSLRRPSPLADQGYGSRPHCVQ